MPLSPHASMMQMLNGITKGRDHLLRREVAVRNVRRNISKTIGCLSLFCLMAVSGLAQVDDQTLFGGVLTPTGNSSGQQNYPAADPVQTSPKVLTSDPSQQRGQQDTDFGDTTNSRSQSYRSGQNTQVLPEPPTQLTPYQRLVAASVGRVLPIYGTNLFMNVPSTFAPVDRIPVTTDYVIGPGDELLVRLWGQVTLDGHFTVDRSGNIYIPQVGSVRVAGVPFANLTDFLRSRIGRTFKNFDINVNIGQLRSIQIFVVGMAKRPGSYTVSSLSTLVNALFASGGPALSGSMRTIQVKRGSQTVTTFDMYDLLLRGDKSKDIALVSGDVIYIPPAGPMVALAGSVDTPAIYEMKADSTISDAISLAGGLTTLAQDKQLRLERITHRNSRTILDVPMDQTGMATALMDGDILEVTPIVDRFKNAVTLRGNVADPRRFAWFSGMRLSDLIPNRDALLTRDFWQKRNQLGLPLLDSTPNVRRYAPDAPVAQVNGRGLEPTRSASMLNLPNAQDSDTNVYGKTTASALSANGSEQSSLMQGAQGFENNSQNGTEPVDGNGHGTTNGVLSGSTPINATTNGASSASSATVSSAVTGAAQRFPARNGVVLSAPDVDWAYAVIERLDPRDLTTHLISFNLGRLIMEGDATQNLELQPGDVVTIFSKADIRVPQVQQTKYVRLEGEFVASGIYSVAPGETLRQLVARAGGLTANAYLYGSQFSRESTRVLQQQRLNEYAADLDRRIRLAEANSANNVLNPQDQVSDIAALQNARTVAQRLRQLTASGRVVLNVKPTSKTVDDVPDLALEDGDVFIIPQVPASVDVFGAVYTQSSFLYDSHRRAGDYLRQAGGGTRTADRKRSYVVRADGSIISRQFSSTIFSGNFDSTRLYPGDAVIVPEAVDRRPLLRNLVDIATIVGQFGLGIAAINVLK